jgi:putative transcriptional regulator
MYFLGTLLYWWILNKEKCNIYIDFCNIYVTIIPMECDKTLDNKVKIARVKIGLTQQQLADKVGVTRQTISLIEKGKYNPSLNLCLQICYEVDSKLDEIFWVDKGDLNENN